MPILDEWSRESKFSSGWFYNLKLVKENTKKY